MGADEAGTHERLMACRRTIEGLIGKHDGRVVGTAGDSLLADFPSAIAALSSAVDIQRTLHAQNAALPSGQRLEFRIGINLGDVIVDGDDIFGDGVNVAARLEGLAEPGSIWISGKVYDEVKNKLKLVFRDRGTQSVKNIAEPVRVYSVEPEGTAAAAAGTFRGARLLGVIGALGALALVAGGASWIALPLWQQEEVETPSVAKRQAPSAPGAESGKPGLGAKPTIAVLPFENLSDDAEQRYFSDGVTQDIIAALGRFSNLAVMSWDAVLPYRSGASSLDQVNDDLGVRYVVRGTVRRAGDRVRVAVQLTDAAQGILLWSERYDQQIDDIFAVQDEITRGVVGALAVKLTALEQARVSSKPTGNLAAYDYVLRARQLLKRRTRSSNFEARALLERAIELDPSYGAAYARLAETYHDDAADGWTEWPHRALQKAEDLAREAVALDDRNASAHAVLGRVYSVLRKHHLALSEIDRAIEINPNDPANYGERGTVMLYLGQPDEAIRSLETALRFDPNLEPGNFMDLGIAYYLEGRIDEAISTLESGVARDPNFGGSQIMLSAAYAEAGRLEEAKRTASEVRRLFPFFDAAMFSSSLPFHGPGNRDRIATALRKAGLE
jgi:adenylate cyclase